MEREGPGAQGGQRALEGQKQLPHQMANSRLWWLMPGHLLTWQGASGRGTPGPGRLLAAPGLYLRRSCWRTRRGWPSASGRRGCRPSACRPRSRPVAAPRCRRSSTRGRPQSSCSRLRGELSQGLPEAPVGLAFSRSPRGPAQAGGGDPEDGGPGEGQSRIPATPQQAATVLPRVPGSGGAFGEEPAGRGVSRVCRGAARAMGAVTTGGVDGPQSPPPAQSPRRCLPSSGRGEVLPAGCPFANRQAAAEALRGPGWNQRGVT